MRAATEIAASFAAYTDPLERRTAAREEQKRQVVAA